MTILDAANVQHKVRNEYQHEQTTHERLVYRDEEEGTKAAKRGLWKEPKPVPPWEWRR